MSTDQELLHAYCHQHEEAAFAQLVQRHSALVLAACRRITGDHHDAEDATQAVFIVLASKASALGTCDCLAAWLHRVACYAAMRQRTARWRRRREVAMSSPDAHLAASSTAPTALMDAEPASWSRDLDTALAALPIRYRQPLILYYLEGRSTGEIASSLAISEDLVATRLSRARERLRHRLRAAPAGDLGLALIALCRSTTPAPISTGLGPPSARARTVADACLRAMWVARLAGTGALAGAVLLLALGLLWGWSQVRAEDLPRAPVAAAAGAAGAYEPGQALQGRLSVADCPRWQERLLVALERRVTVHAQDLPGLAIIDAIGQQCGLTMVVDLPAGRTRLPDLSIDALAAPLEQVLDEIAQRTATRYQLYAGSVLWRAAADWEPWDAALPWAHPEEPLSRRIYRLEDLPAGTDQQSVVNDLQAHVAIDLDQPGYGITVYPDAFEISVPPIKHLAIEAYLAARWDPMLPAAARLEVGPIIADKDPASARAMAAARLLDSALKRTLGCEIPDRQVRAALARIATISGIVIAIAPEDGDLPLRERPIPARLTRLSVRDAIALTLDGTGLHACMDVPATAGPGAAAILVVSKIPTLTMATVTYRPAPRTPGPGGSRWSGNNLMDPITSSIARESWSMRTLVITPGGAQLYQPAPVLAPGWFSAEIAATCSQEHLEITHCLEVQLDLQEQVPRLSAFLCGEPLPPTLAAPWPLVLVPPQRPADLNAPSPAGLGEDEMPKQRL